MPDYRQPLEFGSFLTPSAGDPARVVDLALVSERAGLDLVTIQDHPYQSRFLDTWTLLSWIAARTTTVTVAPNVANLPLRGPVILARSAASLDRLSGGRVELGLGSGAFWDAVAANGGPRRSAGQAVTALADAIAVIRALWSDEKGGAKTIASFLRDDVLERVQGLRPVADELGLTMAQLAIAWVLSNDNVAAAIIGASRPEQVHDNAKAAGVKLPAEVLTRIDEILGDVVVRDPAETAKSSPAARLV